ncbi:hypothetical protein [Streptomyces justiciae]|uniref:hypothetical protein n=1 Tax=Streptomyces justiciae TaxID=2780140 RepID=UPI002117C17B|nr:hypothetical protein [Streptomyces justiciae]MCW8380816.1 hypothetical protein [Streptomyces justiciae]
MVDEPVLVRVVVAEVGEGLAGVLVGVAADAVILCTLDDLGLSGTTGRIQVIGVTCMAVLWAVNFLVTRPRQLRAFKSAVPVADVSVLDRPAEQTRQLLRGRFRMAAFIAVTTLAGAYLLHFPLFGLQFQLMLAFGLVHTRRTAIWWERRHRVHLWKPALSAVGRENYRRSPYYATPAVGSSLADTA